MASASDPAGHLLGPVFHAPLVRAVYATRPEDSRGRLFAEAESATRTCYQRDRDRIIHSTAFRRLKHKTQVFVEHEGDYYRTRMTHSLEVAQIARSAARVLALDEDLAEAVALAHDLGHTPFGHAGEDALSAATASIGGFDHNAHGLRLVAKLEHRYAGFDGLNLTWETLEGLVKHNGPLSFETVAALPPQDEGGGERASRVAEPIARFDARWPLDLGTWPGLEAQVAALADDIAYLNHDIDDGLRARLFTVEDLFAAPLAGPRAEAIVARYGELETGRFIGELVSVLIGVLVIDLLEETEKRLAQAKPGSAAEVRGAGGPLAAFSPAMEAEARALKAFLFTHMYRHQHVMASMTRAKELIGELFAALAGNPALLPADWAKQCGEPGDAVTQGVVRDYIAGMTDGYAIQEYSRIFHKDVRL
jgi:dGTPase